ncbi:Mn transporter [candidate division WOR-1 bacterium RIFOXYA12_FULL_43_27]|uniref:Mn transporter n=1 Tax=candidate division WOR-1 bacterium RIFOXYC2_FULL_46_14 TaxID=1802587 RepID=A0A1F4U781_UNCSA|nr:MAG: Mn transporter [candidate division WOR-1 bacterium RIFOXYA12_FULL_43_27]OGC19180.1 MAG: Mn transporter [candidate division WOR-1 bacterium RIFOXYB2_FULL_46_45]OGC30169.1 MAG: Mn transporter [candidate division WOR-1 bacterium RIFOXYA2_FULL_46_56]OGC40771.1 MAG: Mn transporter [candidate division WOR-1 bacterium RIFOXYC2_FULL_46_14]
MKRLLNHTKKYWIFFAILGPGIITACADNDAGGITTYSIAGAHFGYSLLWMLLITTFCLAVVQEICARMGAVTGKGLSDLIRENFGLKWTFFAMTILLIANIFTLIANFAGIAASLEIFGFTKWLSVPVVAFLIWYTVLKGSYKTVERIFLVFCLAQFAYVFSGILANPDWGLALKSTFVPSFQFDSHYLLIFIGVIGTTITPWMQFYIQSAVRDKGITVRQYKYERAGVLFGAFFTDFISFFIIVSCAATLYKMGVNINSAKDAAIALGPIAGNFAETLFALGLFGASTLTASIVSLSSAYAICEAFGWENGINKQFREAPVFYGLYTFLIILAASVVLLPSLPLIFVMLLSQEINGILLPFILVFMILLVNNKRIMGTHVNSRFYNVMAWFTVIALIVLTGILLVSAFL